MKTLARLLPLILPLAASAADTPLTAGGHTVAVVRAEAAPMKPYVKTLQSPAGVQVLADSPPDHFHHHGLMFALGAEGVDFWTEKGVDNAGRQRPAGEPEIRDGLVAQQIDWIGPDDAPLLIERRGIKVAAEPGVTWLRWTTTIQPAPGRAETKLWGRHYFGLGLRFVSNFAGRVAFQWETAATGRVVRGDERVTPGRWCAATADMDGKPVTVAVFDRPGNARPAEWFTMGRPFAYLAATLDLENRPHPLKAAEAWTLDYTIAVVDGAPGRAELAALAARAAARD